MALFLTRAASLAGIDLGETMDMGFTDLDSTGANRVAAINTLAANDIMPGRTATTFDPGGTVTRADMALHLFRLLDLALDEVLIDMLPDSLEGNTDGVGKIAINATNGVGDRIDDYFGDARRTLPVHMDDIIGAIYELGVTAGTNGMVGEHGTFEPANPVSRAQMATFIMSALGHTNLRPAGLTAQHTATETQVSVRDADFAPVVDERVEVFYSNFSDHAFDSSGECIDRFVEAYSPSFTECEIDRGDPRTDDFGNHEFPFGSQLSNMLSIVCTGTTPNGGYTLTVDAPSSIAQFVAWAWQGA